MKRFLLILFITILTTAMIIAFFPLVEANGIYEQVIRLHVIANSDSDEDQQLKLHVRDEVLDRIGVIVDGCEDVSEAYNAINDNLDLLESSAKDAVAEYGYQYNVKTLLTNEYYPTKEYEEVTLPSGEYISLRVIIGEGKGKNWWCVLYPPLCTGSASVKEELSETGFTPSQIRLITDSEDSEYRVRFKIVEFFSDVKYRFKKLFS